MWRKRMPFRHSWGTNRSLWNIRYACGRYRRLQAWLVWILRPTWILTPHVLNIFSFSKPVVERIDPRFNHMPSGISEAQRIVMNVAVSIQTLWIDLQATERIGTSKSP